MDNLCLKVENIEAKGEIASFMFYVFKKPSAEKASESVYMREKVKCNILSCQDVKWHIGMLLAQT